MKKVKIGGAHNRKNCRFLNKHVVDGYQEALKIYFPHQEYLSDVNEGYANFPHKIITVDYNIPLRKTKNTFKCGLIKVMR